MADLRDTSATGSVGDELTGKTVNRYLVQARLGAGGMGEVYRAEDPTLRRMVAIKRMLRRDGSEADRVHCLREGQRASSLNHPNIAAVYDVLLEGGEVLLVMEYIPGETLRARLARPVLLSEFYAIAVQCAEALGAAHTHGVLHGDVKPENIMLSSLNGGAVKLLDFGVARTLPNAEAATETLLTLGASIAGTPRYMAPELFAGQQPDTRADIFALGIVMYEMLSGRHPFAGRSDAASVGRILYQQPTSLRVGQQVTAGHATKGGHAGHISGRLSAVVEKALAKDPDQRYSSARQLAEDLRGLQTGRRVRGLKGAGPKTRLRWAATAAGLLVLVGGAAFLMAPGRRPLSAGSRGAPLSSAALLAPHRNLAVMAPTVAGADPRLEAFGNGLAESVAAKLSELGANHDLAVVPPEELRSKSATTLEQARQEFGSTMGLFVSLQSLNDRTRTAYSLIDAGTGHILAGSNITAGSSDLFTLEDEVASGVAGALQLTLRPEETRALEANATTQPEAYRYFLEGVGYLHESINPEEIGKAEALFKEALTLDPKYGAAQAGLGEAYWNRYKATKEGRWIDQARSACQGAVALGNAGAQGHVCLGTLDNGTGAYSTAVEEFTQATQLEPSNDAAYLGLARAYGSLGQPGKAEEIYQSVIRLRPQYWRGYNMLGAFYLDQAQYEKAATMFAKAEQLAPDNYHVSSNLGGSLLYLGRDEEAARSLQRSIAIRPSWFGYQNIGVAYFRLREFSRAAESFRAGLALNANEYDTWGALGDALYYGHASTGAPDAYRRAITLAEQQSKVNPKDADVLGDLASYYSMLGEAAQAKTLLERALALEPKDQELIFDAALVYNQLGQKEAALDWLAKAIDAGYPRSMITKAVALDALRESPRYLQLMRGNGRQ